jgi:anti-sigma-K factor RskA
MSDERRDLGREPGRDRFDDLKEAYALGALSEEERQEFEDYLAAHPELRAEVDDLKSVANLLALAPQEYEPPPELRRSLMDRIAASSPGATLADRPPRQGVLRRLFGPGRLVAAAVLALAFVGLFVWNVSLRGENEAMRDELQGQRTIYELQGTGAARDVRGEVVRIGDERAVLVAENLPSAPEGKVYEAWLMRDDIPEPAGLFEPPRDGGAAAAPIEGSLRDADAVAVTVEPSGGSSAPTSEPLLTADM